MNRLQATEEKKCCRFFCDRIGFRNARGLLRVWPLMSCFASAIMNSSLMVFGFLYPNTLFRYLFRTERDETRQNDNPLAQRWEDPPEIRRLWVSRHALFLLGRDMYP